MKILTMKSNSLKYMKKKLIYLNSSQVLSVTGVFDLADCEWPRQLPMEFPIACPTGPVHPGQQSGSFDVLTVADGYLIRNEQQFRTVAYLFKVIEFLLILEWYYQLCWTKRLIITVIIITMFRCLAPTISQVIHFA